MPTQRQLLTVAAVIEWLAGLALILAPGATVALLLGADAESVGLMIGRVAGVALLALGIACWGARSDAGGPARSGTLWAIAVYNGAAGALLVWFAASGQARGIVVWSTGGLHLLLAVGFAAAVWRTRKPRPRNP
jgi:hypothetical protein